MSDAAPLPPREWFALARVPWLHADHLRALRERHEPVQSLVGRPANELAALGIPATAAARLSQPYEHEIDADRLWAQASDVRLVTLDEPAYPPRLKEVPTAPLVVWVRGDVTALHDPQVAIVGSRHPTTGGARHAAAFARGLVACGLSITSGLARGIDAAAHEGALAAGGRTVAVCGTGLDQCYPPRNAPLAARIAASGAVISEFPPGTEPRAEHFPRRNRIISALSRGVLVVEAALDSGSLITARLAAEQSRSVFAVPGSIDSPVSRGCHKLIREGVALVQNVQEVLDELNCASGNNLQFQAVESAPELSVSARWLDKPGEMLLDALGFEPASIDDLIGRTGHSAQDIAVRLGRLQLEGLVEMLPGGRYGRLSPAT